MTDSQATSRQHTPISQDGDTDAAVGGVRRRVLQMGVLGVAAVVTIRPAVAQAATSVMTCTIPVPDPGRLGSSISADGSVVPAGTAGSFEGAVRPLPAQDVKAALRGRSFPGVDPKQSQAWTNYIRRLQQGQSGFTCYASLQTPGRS